MRSYIRGYGYHQQSRCTIEEIISIVTVISESKEQEASREIRVNV